MSCFARNPFFALVFFSSCLLLASPLLATPVSVTVVIENRAPAGGTWQSPTWVGFHDGSFDFFDAGAPASAALESLAEDGDVSALNDLFDLESPDGLRDLLVSGGEVPPPLAPGQSVSRTFVLDDANPDHRYFSWASMVLPSNDAFLGTEDPQAHRVFTNSGSFLGGYIPVDGSQVWNAGTEVNDEDPTNTAFYGQAGPNTGQDENGNIQLHPGFLAPGMGGILDDPDFQMADFTVPGYDMISITLYRTETMVSAGEVSGTWRRTNSPYMVEGDITVPEGQTLSLEPGVLVHVIDGKEILVRGELEAIGTAADPIKFTGPDAGQAWRGLQIEGENGHAVLEYCILEYGNRNWDYEYGGVINVEDGTLDARHCTIRESHSWLGGAGIFGDHATLNISHCDIFNNTINSSNSAEGGGILAEYCDVQISDCKISDNELRTFTYFGATNSRGGGIALRNSEGVVERNIITGNYITHSGTNTESAGGGIYVQGYGAQMVNNIVTGNNGSGIWIEAGGLNFGYNDVWNNTPQDFGGSLVPAGAGMISGFNNNGDPSDDYFNISSNPLL